MEHDHVIEAFATNGANHPLDIGSLPRRARCRQDFANAHVSHVFSEVIAKDRIAVAQEVARELGKGKCLAQFCPVQSAPTSVVGGPLGSSTGTVKLSGPASAGGALVTLSSSNAAASVPSSVTVPAGSTSATFTVNTPIVLISTSATISASYNNTTQSASLAILL